MFNRVNDFYFKYLLGRIEHKEITLNFINSALSESGKQFTDIIFTDKDEDPEFVNGKQSRLDIKGVLDDGSIIDIEMQVLYYGHMAERSLYYWARMYGEQLHQAGDYGLLKQTIALNVLDFEYLPETSWVNKYKILNIESKQALTDHLYIAFLELPKLVKLFKAKQKKLSEMKDIERWGAYFSGLISDEEMEGEPMLEMVLQAEKYFTADAQLRRKYEQREAFLRDMRSFEVQAEENNKKAREDGFAEGLADGMAQGRTQGRTQGRIQGRTEGAELINALYAKLVQLGRMEDMQKAFADKDYRQKLLEELMPEKA